MEMQLEMIVYLPKQRISLLSRKVGEFGIGLIKHSVD